MNRVLEIKELKTHFHRYDHTIRAVDGVGLSLDQGETLGVVGESGCGKSVMSLSIMRLIPSPPGRIESGEILFRGEDLLTATDERMLHWLREASPEILSTRWAIRFPSPSSFTGAWRRRRLWRSAPDSLTWLEFPIRSSGFTSIRFS